VSTVRTIEGDGAALPPERAFVLQFRQDAGAAAEAFAGRIEHVTSGRHARFQSIDQAVAFIASVLRRQVGEGES
jgi:hypothetical protein